jgi:hypothetical protein
MTHGTFIHSVDGDGSTFIIIVIYAVELCKTGTPINCIKTSAVCTWHRTTVRLLLLFIAILLPSWRRHQLCLNEVTRMSDYDMHEVRSVNLIELFWFSLQLLCETFLILRRIERDVINANTCTSSCRVCVILVIFSWNLVCLRSFDTYWLQIS